jgi:hypothetical protein
MKRYAVVVMVDSDDGPMEVAKEIVSALEFEHRSAVRSVSVLDEDGKEVAVYKRKEQTT